MDSDSLSLFLSAIRLSTLSQILDKFDVKEGEKYSYWYNLIYQLFLDLNYQFRAKVIRASDFGDPQNRPRVFIIAAKRGRPLPQWPEPTHGPDLSTPHVTAQDALGSLEAFPPDCDDGGNGMVCLQDGTITQDHVWLPLKKTEKYNETLVANKPAMTVRRTNGIRHYAFDRNLTVRELARLQGFPDTYEFCGSTSQKRSQVGNAVPAHLATSIAKAIFESLNY